MTGVPLRPVAAPAPSAAQRPLDGPILRSVAGPEAPDGSSGPDGVAAVEGLLDATLAERAATLTSVSPDLAPVLEALRVTATGGKRLRATFCLLGARSWAGGPVAGDVEVAAAVEMFHLAALVHDDLMDRSDLRRGRRTVHHRFASDHRAERGEGDPDRFGDSVAVLAGDLCLMWSDDLLAAGTRAGERSRADAVRAAWSRMRDETVAGQYLDVLAHTRTRIDVAEARRVLRYKSAKYTVEQPLLLGARLAGAPTEVIDALSEIGLAAGEAFQLRDDLLGVFGDPAVTGKPAVDDVREGKRTLLVALAETGATTAQRQVLRTTLGDPDVDDAGLAAVREVLTSTGAVDEVEQRITALAARALDLVTGLPVAPDARERLADLIGLCAWRDV